MTEAQRRADCMARHPSSQCLTCARHTVPGTPGRPVHLCPSCWKLAGQPEPAGGTSLTAGAPVPPYVSLDCRDGVHRACEGLGCRCYCHVAHKPVDWVGVAAFLLLVVVVVLPALAWLFYGPGQ